VTIDKVCLLASAFKKVERMQEDSLINLMSQGHVFPQFSLMSETDKPLRFTDWLTLFSTFASSDLNGHGGTIRPNTEILRQSSQGLEKLYCTP
jgi:hypothetical protein